MESKFAEGVSVYAPREGAPEFIIADLSIDIVKLREWANANQDLLVDGKDNKVLRMQIKRSKNGKLYADVNNFKPAPKEEPRNNLRKDQRVEKLAESLSLEPDDDLPF